MNNRATERIAEMFSHYPPLQFDYDAESKLFRIGEEMVALDAYAEYCQPQSESIDVAKVEELIDESALLLNVFDTHYQVPRMTEWLKSFTSSKTKAVFDGITDVMVDAYATVGSLKRKELHKGSHWGFGVSFYRPGHPVFNVVGDCACYGVSPHGNYIDESLWGTGFAEYESHNIDWQPQIVALHAGAGALARMCQLELA